MKLNSGESTHHTKGRLVSVPCVELTKLLLAAEHVRYAAQPQQTCATPVRASVQPGSAQAVLHAVVEPQCVSPSGTLPRRTAAMQNRTRLAETCTATALG